MGRSLFGSIQPILSALNGAVARSLCQMERCRTTCETYGYEPCSRKNQASHGRKSIASIVLGPGELGHSRPLYGSRVCGRISTGILCQPRVLVCKRTFSMWLSRRISERKTGDLLMYPALGHIYLCWACHAPKNAH